MIKAAELKKKIQALGVKKIIQAIVLLAVLLTCVFKLDYAYNTTTSLPYKHFLIIKYPKAKVGDYVLFPAPESSIYKGFYGIKQIKGKESDSITRKDRAVYVNDEYVGTAKYQSLTGVDLEVIDESIIPANKFYVAGTSLDSFDSRYSNFGLLDADTIIGIAIPLW